MSPASDPFSFHPELRDKISDPLQSFFRQFNIEQMAARLKELGAPTGWWHSNREREASRTKTLSQLPDDDLWVFAYGSLMWDPGIRFAEVRRTRLPDHSRRFILKDIYGARGTPEAPGLMAALDVGSGCEGLMFRVDRSNIEVETEVLWRREKVAPAYTPTFVQAQIQDRSVTALTFVADHEADTIEPDLTRDEQIRFMATGTGFLGSSRDYLKNIAEHFEALGIQDEDVVALFQDTEAYIKANSSHQMIQSSHISL